MTPNSTHFQFRPEDYVILCVSLLLSAGFGLYVSTVKHKQSSLVEYFIAGRNAPLAFVVLSYFSSFAAGGMTGLAMETYSFGAQIIISAFVLTPVSCCLLHYVVVPVFYRVQNISMLKYFEIRFGRKVSLMAMVTNVSQMTMIGSANLYVAATVIYQVTALSFWISASIVAGVCIIYSTLGGMRGIVVADTIQAIIMIIAIVFLTIMGIIKSGGLKAIWDINSKYERLQLFNMSLDPTVRLTFWSTIFGYCFTTISFMLTNQSLLQRCLMAPNIKSAQKIANVGSSMTYIYILMFQTLGLIIFGHYNGCNIVQNGSIDNINQLLPYYAMEILEQYPTLPGIFFSGIICSALSTISSLLNSISAHIMTHSLQVLPKMSDKMSTCLCKVIVAVFGGIMFLGIVVIDNFYHFNQAATILASVISGPTFAILCIGILCPKSNPKSVGISFLTSILFSVWITVGMIMTSPTDATPPFAICSSNSSINWTNITESTNTNNSVAETITNWNIEAYFPLSKVSYLYVSLEAFSITVVCFILLSILMGRKQTKDDSDETDRLTLELIPHCVRQLQLKMSRRWRRLLLCDVYGDTDGIVQVEQHLFEDNVGAAVE